MRYKDLKLVLIIILISFFANSNACAQDPLHDQAMSALSSFFADPLAREDYAAKHPAAMKAEQDLLFFPPHIQKRLEKVVLMIMQESGSGATRHLEAAKASGPEGAFQSFSPAVQKEIQEIARELEKDPEFVKKAGSFGR
jgi:hypothetical protein